KTTTSKTTTMPDKTVEPTLRDQMEADRINRLSEMVRKEVGGVGEDEAKALDLLTTQDIPEQPMPIAEPLPRSPNVLEKVMMGLGAATGYLQPLLGIPFRNVQRKREMVKNRDVKNVQFAFDMLKENPDGFAQLIKSPGFRDSMQRELRLDPDEILEISNMAMNFPSTAEEIMRGLAQGSIEPKGGAGTQFFPGPGGTEFQAVPSDRQEGEQREAEALEALRQEFGQRGLDPDSITQLDVWASMDPKFTKMGSLRGKIVIHNTATGETKEINSAELNKSNMFVKPIEDTMTGDVKGFMYVDKDSLYLDEETGEVKGSYGQLLFEDLIQEEMNEEAAKEGVSVEELSPEKKDGVWKRVLKIWKGFTGELKQNLEGENDIPEQIPEEFNPNPKKKKGSKNNEEVSNYIKSVTG
ncbi:MAG: hypothetical protein GWN17_00180, partial [Candidatus Korarchaeota archaeon]|nr:hypothetical protein [Candidatus Korarchaeota archaeon]